ncbi:SIR2 family histone deacetylase [Xylariaceae sp. FL0804]|nr:SIR2 family histone deacetylase [Xylariaceae sp. FL0804]
MGQEVSSEVVSDDTPTETLSERSLAAIADYIKQGRAKRIVVLTGAGISTAAGIPDFRSPKTGLYHNLARLNLPHPEAVFDLDFFKNDPRPFYILARELYPGNFQPTVSHAFIALLARRKLLHMLFTQNIDCLERVAGVPPELIVEAHGSFATQRCIACQTAFPDRAMREHVDRGEPPSCVRGREECGGLVKPDIVFFGEQLPRAFHDAAAHAPAAADLLLVLGTSLSVYPFAGLPRLARERAPRLLLNLERVGDLGTRADDVLCLGECDAGVRRLADALGWRAELEEMWEGVVGAEEARKQRASSRQRRDAEMEGELDRLVESMEEKLELSEDPPAGRVDTGNADLGEQDKKGGEEAQQGGSGAQDAQGAAAHGAAEVRAGAGQGQGQGGRPAHAAGEMVVGQEADQNQAASSSSSSTKAGTGEEAAAAGTAPLLKGDRGGYADAAATTPRGDTASSSFPGRDAAEVVAPGTEDEPARKAPADGGEDKSVL